MTVAWRWRGGEALSQVAARHSSSLVVHLPRRYLPAQKLDDCETFPIEDPRDGTAGAGRPAAGPARLLLALRAPDEGLVRGDVRRQPGRGAARHADSALHRQAGVAHGGGRSPGGARGAMAAARGHGGAHALRAAGDDALRHRDPPQRPDPRGHEPDALAEPLARRAPELAVLPER